MFRFSLPAALLAGLGHAEPLANGLPLASGRLTALVLDSAEKTLVTGYLSDLPFAKFHPSDGSSDWKPAVAAFLKNPPATIALRIDWLGGAPPSSEVVRSHDFARGIATATYDFGGTHITRTVLASAEDDAIFIHFLAGKPGALSFRATLLPPDGTGGVAIEDRRQLAWTSAADPAAKARVWVIPFESDVAAEGESIVLRGEGECLLVFNFASSENPEKRIENTWKRLAARHDPSQIPPDPPKIWRAIFARATAP